MELGEKIKLLADMLEINPSEINPGTRLDSISTWDSMSALLLIVLLEDHFGKTEIDGGKIKSFKLVGDILSEMER
jgi:acyl carrier protein